MNIRNTPQLTLIFGRFFGQDMTFERLGALNAATCSESKALCSATFSFDFWHTTSSFMYEARCFH